MNAILHTPLSELARGRVTGRLDWRGALADSGLPAEVRDLIADVVTRANLRRGEQADVAADLTAHFTDALAAGAMSAEAVTDFGNPLAAARLIHRAKLRQRGWPWLAQQAITVAALAVLLVAGAEVLRFHVQQPTPRVDHLTAVNAPILATPEADRAWPLYERAIAADGIDITALPPADAEAYEYEGPAAVSDKGLRAMLAPASDTLRLTRAAADRPALGRVIGPEHGEADGLFVAALPNLSAFRGLAEAVAADLRLAAREGDAARVEANVLTIWRTGRQMQGSPVLIEHMVGGAIEQLGHRTLRDAALGPDLLDAAARERLAAAADVPPVPPDYVAERRLFLDLLQHSFADGGDGRLTRTGLLRLREWGTVRSSTYGQSSTDAAVWAAVADPAIAAYVADGVAQRAAYDSVYDRLHVELARPLAERDIPAVQAAADEVMADRRLIAAGSLAHVLGRLPVSSARLAAERDATVAALRRTDHGLARYDASGPRVTADLPAWARAVSEPAEGPVPMWDSQ